VQCLVDLAGNQTLAKLVKHAVGIPIPPESMREVMVKALGIITIGLVISWSGGRRQLLR
jgi:hypothetical protein